MKRIITLLLLSISMIACDPVLTIAQVAPSQCWTPTNLKLNLYDNGFNFRYATFTFDKYPGANEFTYYDILYVPKVFVTSDTWDYLYSHQYCAARYGGGSKTPTVTITGFDLIPGVEYLVYLVAAEKQTGAFFCYSPLITFTAPGTSYINCNTLGCANKCPDATSGSSATPVVKTIIPEMKPGKKK